MTNDGVDLFVLLRLAFSGVTVGAAVDRYDLASGDFKYRMIYDAVPPLPRTNIKSARTVQSITYSAQMVGVDGQSITVVYTGGAPTSTPIVTRVANDFTIQIKDPVTIASEILTELNTYNAGSEFPKLLATTTNPSEVQQVAFLPAPKHLNEPVGSIFGQRFVCIGNEIFAAHDRNIMRIVKAL